ncbi:MAG TPA: ATP-binding protein [Candidatus Limnocylindria bacterium]|nr:ATP-binding protein [Candidatus Limnocylindria bacterium]
MSSLPERAPIETGPSPDATDLAALFGEGLEIGRLERMLLALATHPAGPGFDAAVLWIWNPQHGVLEGRLSWTATPGESLAGALSRARQSAPEGPDPERTRHLRQQSLTPEHLPEALARTLAGGVLQGEPRDALALAAHDLEGRALAAVGLRRGIQPFALLVGGWPRAESPERAEQALESFRRVADAALEAHALGADARRRAHHGAALGEFARAAVSDLNLAEILALLGRLACEATAARGAAVWLADSGTAPHLESTFGPGGTRERLARGLQPLAAAAIDDRRPIVLERVTKEPRLAPEVTAQLSALALLPLCMPSGAGGALAVYDRAAFHPSEGPAFTNADLEFLRTLADHAALVVEHAQRRTELKASERRCRDVREQLTRSERLATLGETVVNVANELRNPIASIGAFARRAHRGLAPEDPNREYLEIVIRETDRLERLAGEQLQVAALGPPRLKLESLNQVVQDVLQQSGEQLVRRRVRLLKKLSPEVPPLLLDAVRIQRVVTNIMDHALESVPPGGRVRIESRRVQEYAIVEIAHDGPQPAGDLLNQLFVPFATAGQGQRGVGLGLAQQIVHEHGGEVRVRSESEWSSIFSFTLPVPINQDRRGADRERRATRKDRRQRYPAA